MGLETGTYIDSLVITNPTATDPKSQGDDHLRLVKSTIKATFPNITGAVTPTHTVLNYMLGVTSAVQTQIDSKGAITGQTWTGTHAFASTTSIGNVSATEISYLDGVTSAIQTQIDTKGAITGQTWTGTHAFPSTVSFGNVSATEISYLDGVTGAIQTQIDGKGAIGGQAWTGTHTFPTQALGSNNTRAATCAYVDQTAFDAALPAQSLGFLISSGTVASFSQTHTGYAQKEVKGANIASAATVNLSTATGNLVHITGTTGITAFTIDSGAEYTVVFDGALTVTHHATTLILPTGANITTAAGDSWKIRGDGAGNARVVSIQRASGQALATLTQSTVCSAQLDKTSDTTLANITGMSATLVAGGTYRFSLIAFTTSISTAGVKFGMNGGSATATAFVAVLQTIGGSAPVHTRVTAIGSAMTDTSATGAVSIVEGTIVCNAGGTFIPQFAQGGSNATASSVLANSTFTVDRIS